MSIRTRIIAMVVLSTLISVSVFISFTYKNITYKVNNKIKENYSLNLQTIGEQLETALNEMHYVASGLTYDGGITSQVSDYILMTNIFERKNARINVERQLILNDFSSKVIGFIAFYEEDAENKVLISNEELLKSIDANNLPVMYKKNSYTIYHCPHLSIVNKNDDDVVLSLSRSIKFVGGREIGLYVESDLFFLKNLFSSLKSTGTRVPLSACITDTDNKIIYSTDTELLPMNSNLIFLQKQTGINAINKYTSMEYVTNHWKLYAFVRKSDYMDIYISVAGEFTVNIIIYVLTYLGLAVFIWKSTYKPLDSFVKEIAKMDVYTLYNHKISKAKEFDEYLKKIYEMRTQICRLVSQVEQEAKRNSHLENQLLLSRINPHFIHNTINNIKLQAAQKGQIDLSDNLSALNNLLHYNLGKNKITTLKDEIHAVDDYLFLQHRIFDFVYKKNIQVPDETLNMRVPSFILQPIVENCFQHGYTKHICIDLNVFKRDEQLVICVKDNGNGITNENLLLLNSKLNSTSFVGMGIGLAYVSSSLKLMYANNAQLNIESKPKEGTQIVISIRDCSS